MLIKLWDWDKKWQCSQVFEGHSHYVMMIVLNPKDNNQFASCSLDRTIKVGGVSSGASYQGIMGFCIGVAQNVAPPPLPAPPSYSSMKVKYAIIASTLLLLSSHLPPHRCGSWAPHTPTSPWRGTTRASTVSSTSREGTSRTSSQGRMTGTRVRVKMWSLQFVRCCCSHL